MNAYVSSYCRCSENPPPRTKSLWQQYIDFFILAEHITLRGECAMPVCVKFGSVAGRNGTRVVICSGKQVFTVMCVWCVFVYIFVK